MSILFGVMARTGQSLPNEWGAEMARASERFPSDHSEVISMDGAKLGCRQRYNTPQSPFARQPVKAEAEEIYVLFDGRLDNREALAEELAIPLHHATCDEELIVKCYQKFGSDIVHHLLGDFAIALYDTARQKTLLVRDHMGIRPLYIAQSEHYFAFSSHQGALLALPWVDQSINPQWVADYLEVCSVSHVDTIYNGIHAVAPAHSVELVAGAITHSQYWELRAKSADNNKAETEYVVGFQALLKQSIACRSRSYGEVSSEFSGGLDSSIITAFANEYAELNNQKLAAYSHVSPPGVTDHVSDIEEETECLESFRHQHPNISYHSRHSENLHVIDAYRYSCNVHSAPPLEDITVLGNDIHRHMQRHDRRILLSGWGGDQCATFRGNNWILDAVNARDWDYLRSEFRYHFSSPLLQKAALQVVRNPLLRSVWRASRRLRTAQFKLFFKMATRPSFHRELGYPFRSYGAFAPDPGLDARQRLEHLIKTPSVAHHAANSTTGAASYGAEYRYPLLDIRLLEYCLALPLWMHRKNGTNRYISRKAMKGFVPDRIRFGIPKSILNNPSSLSRELREKDAIVNLLKQWMKNGEISRYVDLSDAIEAAMNMSPTQTNNVGGKGNLSRRIMMLGLWLDARSASPTS